MQSRLNFKDSFRLMILLLFCFSYVFLYSFHISQFSFQWFYFSSITQNDIFLYICLTQLWRLSSQDLRSLQQYQGPFSVHGMLPRSIGQPTIYWASLSAFRFGSCISSEPLLHWMSPFASMNLFILVLSYLFLPYGNPQHF